MGVGVVCVSDNIKGLNGVSQEVNSSSNTTVKERDYEKARMIGI